ncbi:MAG TPA: ABC transporter permease [Stellaceae bacterium]|nr:ABC transporter permease [Stellaceae bacterium]
MRRPRSTETARFPIDLKWNRWAVPGLVLLLVGFVGPLLLLAVYSVFHDGASGQVVGAASLANYAAILSDPFYLKVLRDTVLLGLVVTAACALLGYPLAYFLARTNSRWRPVLMFLMITPLLISSVIRNIGWIPILGDHGALNTLLLTIGITGSPIALMNNFTGVVIALVHALLPYMTLLLMTVIRSISVDIEDAAKNLGASPWRSFWRVVFPLSRRGLAAGCALVFTITVSSYTTPTILGGGRVLVMATFIAQQIQTVMHYAFGSAFAIVLFLVAVGLSTLASRWLERSEV